MGSNVLWFFPGLITLGHYASLATHLNSECLKSLKHIGLKLYFKVRGTPFPHRCGKAVEITTSPERMGHCASALEKHSAG